MEITTETPTKKNWFTFHFNVADSIQHCGCSIILLIGVLSLFINGKEFVEIIKIIFGR